MKKVLIENGWMSLVQVLAPLLWVFPPCQLQLRPLPCPKLVSLAIETTQILCSLVVSRICNDKAKEQNEHDQFLFCSTEVKKSHSVFNHTEKYNELERVNFDEGTSLQQPLLCP